MTTKDLKKLILDGTNIDISLDLKQEPSDTSYTIKQGNYVYGTPKKPGEFSFVWERNTSIENLIFITEDSKPKKLFKISEEIELESVLNNITFNIRAWYLKSNFNGFEHTPFVKKEEGLYYYMKHVYKTQTEVKNKFEKEYPELSFPVLKSSGFCHLIRDYLKDDLLGPNDLTFMKCLKPSYSNNTGIWFDLNDFQFRYKFVNLCEKAFKFFSPEKINDFHGFEPFNYDMKGLKKFELFLDMYKSYKELTKEIKDYTFESYTEVYKDNVISWDEIINK